MENVIFYSLILFILLLTIPIVMTNCRKDGTSKLISLISLLFSKIGLSSISSLFDSVNKSLIDNQLLCFIISYITIACILLIAVFGYIVGNKYKLITFNVAIGILLLLGALVINYGLSAFYKNIDAGEFVQNAGVKNPVTLLLFVFFIVSMLTYFIIDSKSGTKFNINSKIALNFFIWLAVFMTIFFVGYAKNILFMNDPFTNWKKWTAISIFWIIAILIYLFGFNQQIRQSEKIESKLKPSLFTISVILFIISFYSIFKNSLKKDSYLKNIFKNLSMPGSSILTKLIVYSLLLLVVLLMFIFVLFPFLKTANTYNTASIVLMIISSLIIPVVVKFFGKEQQLSKSIWLTLLFQVLLFLSILLYSVLIPNNKSYTDSSVIMFGFALALFLALTAFSAIRDKLHSVSDLLSIGLKFSSFLMIFLLVIYSIYTLLGVSNTNLYGTKQNVIILNTLLFTVIGIYLLYRAAKSSLDKLFNITTKRTDEDIFNVSLKYFLYCVAFGLLLFMSFFIVNTFDNGGKIILGITGFGVAITILALLGKNFINNNPRLISLIRQSRLLSLFHQIFILIPCFLYDLFEDALKSPSYVYKILAIEVIAIIIYRYIFPKKISELSKKINELLLKKEYQLLNNPVSLDKNTEYSTIINPTTGGKANQKYKFGLSFWCYLNNTTPSNNESSTMYTNILYFGNDRKYHAPAIQYNVSTKTARIVFNYKHKEEFKPDIIIDNVNIPMQKWNNFVLNYSNGTLDVFLNNKLLVSYNKTIPVSPDIAHLVSVGENNGLSGRVCNIMMYDHPLTLTKIHFYYQLLKLKDPPVF